MITTSQIKDLVYQSFDAAGLPDDQDAINRAMQLTRAVEVVFSPTAEADAADTSYQPGVMLFQRYAVIACYIVPLGELTADDSDYATLEVRSMSLGGDDITRFNRLVTTTTGSGNWVTNVPMVMPPVDDLRVADGETKPVFLAVRVEKTGDGVALPPFRCHAIITLL